MTGIIALQTCAADDRRNQIILDDVMQALEEKRPPIVLTERRDHLEFFAAKLRSCARHLVVLRGGMGVKERRGAREQLVGISPHEERLLLATGRYIGEGFDDARLDTLFLTLPVSWRGTLVQYTGRLRRLHPTTRGSHRQFKHSTKAGRVTIAGQPSDDLAPGTYNSILKQAGLKG